MMNPHDEQYLTALEDILVNGTERHDRTGVGTISLFGMRQTYDLQQGFPALTTKKLAWKAVVSELLWFIEGSGDEKRLREILHGDYNSDKTTIWTANANADYWKPKAKFDGDLARIYGVQWRRWEILDWKTKVCKVEKRKGGPDRPFLPPHFERIDVQRGDFIGRKFTNKIGLTFTVVEQNQEKSTPKNTVWNVQFDQTGSIVSALRPNIKRGQVIDPFYKSVFGEGCLGMPIEKRSPYYKAAYTLWYNMMRRCYDHNLPEYHLYGGRGVYVESNWRCFSNFYRDIHGLVGFNKWSTEPTKYCLDKDYFASNCYGKNTCVFITQEYNVALTGATGEKFVATNKHTGNTYDFTIQRWFAREHNIKHSQSISTALNSSPTQSTKNWKFERFSPEEGYVYRQQLVIDQLQGLIDGIKRDPTGRRHILTAWNPGELDQMALPPCHVFSQFYVRDNKYLDCQMYQRSNDFFLGCPFNIASYALLTEMIAHVCGYRAGKLIHITGDAHIYKNHVDQVNEQLCRTPYDPPTLLLNQSINSVDKFTMTDITLDGYKSHESIKAPMAV